MNSNSENFQKTTENCYKDQHFEMWIMDGVFHVVVLSNSFTLDMARKGVKKRIEMAGGRSYLMLSDSRNVENFEKEAREYLSDVESTRCLTAGALLIKSQLQKILGNFFLLINRPDVPAKLFTDKEEALQWLKRFKPYSQH